MNHIRAVFVTLALGTAAMSTAAPLQIPALDGIVFSGPQAAMDTQLRMTGTGARTIALPAATSAESAALKAAAVADKRAPLQIGFGRDVSAGERRVDLAGLEWQTMADGTRIAHVAIESPAAAAVRAELSLAGEPSGLKFRFQGGAATAPVFGPFSWNDVESAGRMSPILDGSMATIEIEAAPDKALAGIALVVPRISHLLVSGAELATVSRLKRVPDIGSSGSCNIDVACVANPSADLLRASSATAQIAFTKTGGTFLCTGALMNSINAAGQPTQIPYFITANHCIGDAAAAATINFYWFFEAATCGSRAVPSFVQTAGGSTLLYTSYDVDVTFVRMNSNPPAGVLMSGWDAGPVFPNTPVITLHHPQGDLKKFSLGQSIDYEHDFDDIQHPPLFEPQGSYLRVRWSQGTTEPGSSGGGVFTRSAATGEYQLRGVLHGGDASCSAPAGLDYFSRFDLAFPAISQFLTGATQPAAGTNAIEYYNVDLDHYFMTAFADETTSIENGGAGRGWLRTGYWFPIDPNRFSAGRASVCRFYGNTAQGGPNSHFYTADPAECNIVKLDLGWKYEDIAFSIRVPVGGACPAGTAPVLRNYNNGFRKTPSDSNHRYTTNPTIYQFMQTQGWAAEGTVMCAP